MALFSYTFGWVEMYGKAVNNERLPFYLCMALGVHQLVDPGAYVDVGVEV